MYLSFLNVTMFWQALLASIVDAGSFCTNARPGCCPDPSASVCLFACLFVDLQALYKSASTIALEMEEHGLLSKMRLANKLPKSTSDLENSQATFATVPGEHRTSWFVP